MSFESQVEWEKFQLNDNGIAYYPGLSRSFCENIPKGKWHQKNKYCLTISPRHNVPQLVHFLNESTYYTGYELIPEIKIQYTWIKTQNVALHFCVFEFGTDEDPSIEDMGEYETSGTSTPNKPNSCIIKLGNKTTGIPKKIIPISQTDNFDPKFDGPQIIYIVEGYNNSQGPFIEPGKIIGYIDLTFTIKFLERGHTTRLGNLISFYINQMGEFINPSDQVIDPIDNPNPDILPGPLNSSLISTYIGTSIEHVNLNPVPEIITRKKIESDYYESIDFTEKDYVTILKRNLSIPKMSYILLQEENLRKTKSLFDGLGVTTQIISLIGEPVNLNKQHLVISGRSLFNYVDSYLDPDHPIELNGFKLTPFSNNPYAKDLLGLDIILNNNVELYGNRAFMASISMDSSKVSKTVFLVGEYGIVMHQTITTSLNLHTKPNSTEASFLTGVDPSGLDTFDSKTVDIEFPSIKEYREPIIPESLKKLPKSVQKAYLDSAPRSVDVVPKLTLVNTSNWGVENARDLKTGLSPIAAVASIGVALAKKGIEFAGMFGIGSEKNGLKVGGIELSFLAIVTPDNARFNLIGKDPLTETILQSSFPIYTGAQKAMMMGDIPGTGLAHLQIDIEMRIEPKFQFLISVPPGCPVERIGLTVTHTITFGIFATLINPVENLVKAIQYSVLMNNIIEKVTQVSQSVQLLLMESTDSAKSYKSGRGTTQLAFNAGCHSAMGFPSQLYNKDGILVKVNSGDVIYLFTGIDIETASTFPLSSYATYPGQPYNLFVVPGCMTQKPGYSIPSQGVLQVDERQNFTYYCQGQLPTEESPAYTILSRKGSITVVDYHETEESKSKITKSKTNKK
jgi:hypothetical protein